MTKPKKVLLFGFAGLILALVLFDAYIFKVMTPNWGALYESESPDGRFTVSVYYNPGVIPFPPWLNPRGRAGTVVLRENKTGKVLQRANVSYVDAGTETPGIAWYKKSNSVGVINVDTWDLPPE